MFPLEGISAETDRPFAIGSGWGGFISLSGELVRKLPVMGLYRDLTSAPNYYYSYIQPEIECPHCHKVIPGASEDTMIYREAIKLGYKACADPRIRCQHLKTVGLPSLRPGMKVQEMKPVEDSYQEVKP